MGKSLFPRVPRTACLVSRTRSRHSTHSRAVRKQCTAEIRCPTATAKGQLSQLVCTEQRLETEVPCGRRAARTPEGTRTGQPDSRVLQLPTDGRHTSPAAFGAANTAGDEVPAGAEQAAMGASRGRDG